MRQPRSLLINSSQTTMSPCPHHNHNHHRHQNNNHLQQSLSLAKQHRHQQRNNNNNNHSHRSSKNVIRASEYKNLRQVVPSLRRQRDLGKVEVVTEAAKYIDHLHTTLIKRFIACGIPESLKDVLGTDNANELNSQHIMNLVTQMAAKQRAGQQQQQPMGAISTPTSQLNQLASSATQLSSSSPNHQVTKITTTTTTIAPPQAAIMKMTTMTPQQRRSLPVPANKRCSTDELSYFGPHK